MRQRSPTATLGLLLSLTAGLLVACAGTPTQESDTAAPTSQRGGDSAAGLPAPNRGCDLDLASTAFGPYTALNQIPTISPDDSESEEQFWSGYPMYRFVITENNFDPCADLSWIRLAGTTRADTAQKVIGTTPESSGAVVLFHRDELLTEPLPVQMAKNLQVQRVADNELELSFGHYAPPGQVITQELRTLNLTWQDERLRIDDAEWYADYSSTRTRLDLTSPPPGSDAPVLPRGNVRNEPFAEEYELAEYPAANFRVPLADDRELRCILRFPPDQPRWGWVGCLAEGAEWPQVTPDFGPPPGPAPLQSVPGGTANYLQISYLPTMLSSTRVDVAAAAEIPFDKTVPDGALTRIEHYVIDTRGDDVTISYGGAGVRIDTETFETTTVRLLDQERWPW